MAWVAAALGAASAITGGVTSILQARKVRKELRKQRRRNEAWYNRRYNEDATERADAQAMMTKMREAIKNRNRAAAGTAAVTGGTEEGVAAEKEQNARAMADTTAQIVANNEVRKDKIEDTYHENDNRFSEQMRGARQQQASNIATSVNAATKAASSIMAARTAGNESAGESATQGETSLGEDAALFDTMGNDETTDNYAWV